jgi:hypothetical protein
MLWSLSSYGSSRSARWPPSSVSASLVCAAGVRRAEGSSSHIGACAGQDAGAALDAGEWAELIELRPETRVQTMEIRILRHPRAGQRLLRRRRAAGPVTTSSAPGVSWAIVVWHPLPHSRCPLGLFRL